MGRLSELYPIHLIIVIPGYFFYWVNLLKGKVELQTSTVCLIKTWYGWLKYLQGKGLWTHWNMLGLHVAPDTIQAGTNMAELN